jgi:mannose-6-phosphate isomerase
MTTDSTLRRPLLLEGKLHETIWGGRHLAMVAGKPVPEGAVIGESWETEVGSRVRNPPLAGETLGALVDRHGESLLGWRAIEVFGRRFPLLTKFIDARQQLSVQVHPNDDYAAAHEGGKLGKTECWYILHAEPGAQLVYGLRRRVTREEVRAAITETRLDDLLRTVEAHAGDVLFVPAGTVHAIGAGIVVYELQEYSDVTYRLYDYGRLDANGKPRELHIERALDVMAYSPPASVRFAPVGLPASEGLAERRALVACRYFVLEELRLAGHLDSPARPSSCEIVTVLEGSVSLGARDAGMSMARGDTAVIPASLDGYSIEGHGARVVRSYVPTVDDAAIALWQDAQRGSPSI